LTTAAATVLSKQAAIDELVNLSKGDEAKAKNPFHPLPMDGRDFLN
jgi:hypothetical protein